MVGDARLECSRSHGIIPPYRLVHVLVLLGLVGDGHILSIVLSLHHSLSPSALRFPLSIRLILPLLLGANLLGIILEEVHACVGTALEVTQIDRFLNNVGVDP